MTVRELVLELLKWPLDCEVKVSDELDTGRDVTGLDYYTAYDTAYVSIEWAVVNHE